MYKLNYDIYGSGKVIGIWRLSDGAYIDLWESKPEYQAFLTWNKAQKTPLDLNSTIEPVKSADPLIAAKTEWAKATTTTQKLTVIAKVLKLEG